MIQGGSNVILLARRADVLKAVSDACIKSHKDSGLQQGGKFVTVQMDVSQKDQVATLWDKVPQDLRNVDILGDLESLSPVS
jgi:3-hydroxy acid dehydrogenase/malonic semialdehyde reductase